MSISIARRGRRPARLPPIPSSLIRTYQPYKNVEHSGPFINSVMPARNAFKRRYGGKRRSSRRRLYRKRIRTLSPYSIVRKLVNVYSTSLDPAAGASAYAYLYLNSAFDPTGSLVSQQPMGFDQYSALYKRYCVINCTLKLEWCSTDNTVPVMVGFTPLEDTTKRTLEHYKELPGTVSSIITPDIDKLTQHARCNIKKTLLPHGGKMLSDDTICAGVGADPARILKGHIWAQGMDSGGGADPTSVKLVITMYQTVVFFVPESPARS